MRNFLLACAIAGCAVSATAQTKAQPVLPAGTPIRVLDGSLGPDWLDGKIGVGADGCTMVFLNQKAKGGYTSVSFAGQRKLQMQKDGAWVDVPVKELNPRQPKACQNGGDND